MKNYIVILTILLVAACQEEQPKESEKEKEVEKDTVLVDTTAVADTLVIPELSEELLSLLEKKTKEYDLPFDLDSAGFSKVMKEMESDLSTKEIKLLSKPLLDHEYTETVEWRTEHLLEMEERKRKGEYEEYVSSLDIGMLRDIVGSMGPILRIDEHSFMILWSIDYGSFEACPFYSGTLIMATLVYQNEMKNTVLIGEVSGGADAPVWGDTEIYSSITKDRIHSKKTNQTCEGDEDENGNEIIETTKSEVEILISEEGFVLAK